ncbi:hypothetical protein CFOL_v3_10172 [Cephalotus follicularis]|uniref:Uncharacterized protein n=1 Tax=Cephalotus follicularis TaxID=3775 RepID=A0A1Q3BFM9_CEPFO|nr:hypothetical protein CFOL_v3_10172 [Cephalotus follicularis]
MDNLPSIEDIFAPMERVPRFEPHLSGHHSAMVAKYDGHRNGRGGLGSHGATRGSGRTGGHFVHTARNLATLLLVMTCTQRLKLYRQYIHMVLIINRQHFQRRRLRLIISVYPGQNMMSLFSLVVVLLLLLLHLSVFLLLVMLPFLISLQDMRTGTMIDGDHTVGGLYHVDHVVAMAATIAAYCGHTS